MSANLSRRRFLNNAALAATAIAVPKSLLSGSTDIIDNEEWFKISVAQWSFKKDFYSGAMKTKDFAQFCASELGIFGIDYLSDFMLDDYQDKTFQHDIRSSAEDLGVENVMIMCHSVGRLGHRDEKTRNKVIDDHFRWVEAAQGMGCQMIRVNPCSSGTRAEQKDLLVASISKVGKYAADHGVDIVIENGWGSDYAFKADFIMDILDEINLPNCGSLPDIGNFQYDDPYVGVEKMMRLAKSVSAKSIDFTPSGRNKFWDYNRYMTIVCESGYRGYVGIEYEGCKKSPIEGVLLTKESLVKERNRLAQRAEERSA